MVAPGPPPLRFKERPYGLPGLAPRHKEQLRLANLLALRCAELATELHQQGKAFVIENPEHWDAEAPAIWLLQEFLAVAALPGVKSVHGDQCRFGGVAKKPTTYLHFGVNLSGLSVRCDHPRKMWRRSDGSFYNSPHESTVQRKVGEHWATKALAAYPARLNRYRAEAFGRARQS